MYTNFNSILKAGIKKHTKIAEILISAILVHIYEGLIPESQQ